MSAARAAAYAGGGTHGKEEVAREGGTAENLRDAWFLLITFEPLVCAEWGKQAQTSGRL